METVISQNSAHEVDSGETQNDLTSEKKALLVAEINAFISWLDEKKVISEKSEINHTFEMPWANEDWIMKVDSKKGVSFNTFISSKCSFEYYTIVVLHEYFHLAIQKVPNKEDATKIKDDFGAELMKLIDIEADFYVALYLREKKSYTLVQYWQVNYEGGTVFVDKWIRSIKFERFIGTLLSICKMFVTYTEGEEFKCYDLYLPTLNPIYTEESLHVLVVRKEHIYFEEIAANYTDFANLKECYKDVSKYSPKKYVYELVKFSCKALKLEVPTDVEKEINAL